MNENKVAKNLLQVVVSFELKPRSKFHLSLDFVHSNWGSWQLTSVNNGQVPLKADHDKVPS